MSVFSLSLSLSPSPTQTYSLSIGGWGKKQSKDTCIFFSWLFSRLAIWIDFSLRVSFVWIDLGDGKFELGYHNIGGAPEWSLCQELHHCWQVGFYWISIKIQSLSDFLSGFCWIWWTSLIDLILPEFCCYSFINSNNGCNYSFRGVYALLSGMLSILSCSLPSVSAHMPVYTSRCISRELFLFSLME